MALTFNDAAVTAVWAALVSDAQQTGRFKKVIQGEPKAAPENFPSYALWWGGPIRPAPRASGLAQVSGVVEFTGRIYQDSMLALPQGDIETGLLATTALLMSAYSGGFTLGGIVRDIDLLGEHGQPLMATPGFIPHDGKWLRVAEIAIPVVINDLWTENA